MLYLRGLHFIYEGYYMEIHIHFNTIAGYEVKVPRSGV